MDERTVETRRFEFRQSQFRTSIFALPSLFRMGLAET